MTNILIAGDNKLLLQAICSMLDGIDHIQVFENNQNGNDFQVVLILLFDNLPEEISKIDVIENKFPYAKKLVISDSQEIDFIRQVAKKKISGILLMKENKEEFIRAIRRVSRGEIYFSSEIVALLLNEKRKIR